MRLLILLLFISVLRADGQADSASIMVTQRIVYKTDKAGQIYLVWAMDNWKEPTKEYWPPGTYVNKGMAYSPMIAAADSFFVDLRLPKGIYIDFMLWAHKDKKGHAMESWDNNWGSNYNVYIDGIEKSHTIKDEKLSIVEAKKRPFTVLEKGWVLLVAGIVLLVTGLGIHYYNKQTRKKTEITINDFIAGFTVSIVLLMLFIRLQLNGYLSQKQYWVFGAGFSDISFMIVFSLIVIISFYLARKIKWLRISFQVFFIVCLVLIMIASILNIEIIRQIGKPLTYNWLYYSDFMQAKDAKNAVKAGLNPLLITNIVLIITGSLMGGFGFAFIRKNISSKPGWIITGAIIVLIFIISFIQNKIRDFDSGKTENPVSALLFSWINASRKPGIFNIRVPETIKDSIERMHYANNPQPLKLTDSITNVVVFVLESTPSNVIQIYDSTIKVTPNINNWKKYSRVYDNMYAHLPTTVNTMLSIVSGIYPMISFKSIIKEYPDIKIPSLPGTLKKEGWLTSLFFSSDLTYSNMGPYLVNQQVETVEDAKVIPCSYDKFNSNYAQLDGLDDRCIVNRYLDWKRRNEGKKTFSILWTNQTHYPYFFSGDQKKYSDNPELSKYLNALEEVDSAFGHMMTTLQNNNELNKTLVIVVGDHGEAFGTHNQYTHGAQIYEENMKVPCMLINPLLFNGEIDKRIGGIIDLAPTISHVVGVTRPKEWQGRSLLGESPRSHTFLLGPYSDYLFGSRFLNWKLIYNATNNEFKLFDIEKDPGELKNIAAEKKDLVKQQYEFLAGWVQFNNNHIKAYKNLK